MPRLTVAAFQFECYRFWLALRSAEDAAKDASAPVGVLVSITPVPVTTILLIALAVTLHEALAKSL